MSSSSDIHISRIDGDSVVSMEDSVAVEEPLEIRLSSNTPSGAAAKSISITMRTPGSDVELALGFLFTEGIITDRDQVSGARSVGEPDEASGLQNTVLVEIRPDVELDLSRLERHFYTTSSCGVCGKASIDALRVTNRESLKDKGATFSRKLIREMPDKLLRQQQLFSRTGGLHAAAVFDHAGEIMVVREDVGRHNAVDKVVGALLQAGQLPANDYGLLVSGRVSFELVQKALVAGIPSLVAVSAPSSLAVKLAEEFGMTLIGFLRGDRFNIYAGERRIN
jgi:FdhD protein